MSEEQEDGIAWWLKLLLNAIGTLAAILCTIQGFMGVFSLVTINGWGVLQSVLFFVLAFFLFLLEATIVCKSFSFAERFLGIVDKVKYWQKAALYGGICIVIAVLDFSMSIVQFGLDV